MRCKAGLTHVTLTTILWPGVKIPTDTRVASLLQFQPRARAAGLHLCECSTQSGSEEGPRGRATAQVGIMLATAGGQGHCHQLWEPQFLGAQEKRCLLAGLSEGVYPTPQHHNLPISRGY